ncbi:generic methyltransferase [Helicobacter cinaedi CCUG 18818 = ATCC BAA-847]|uniref:Generic methyltransferase n=2 Tax=Helicobacter cinaedi TaxID=213 RepID=A0AAI8QH28_9HELI|nr:class I SAM-dependent methyltransferase [Helicobacter cinaedi]BAM32308.1 generic methyltransferase [Helicobacter cinaedi CCUG 18818 = ATCC BAA-847]
MQIKESVIINGITYFAPPPYKSTLKSQTSQFTEQTLESNANFHFPSEGMDMLYLAENKHFWHIARREFIYQEISRILVSLYPQDNGKSTKVLDVGAGTGSVTRHFLSQGFNNIALGEIHPQGLEYAKTYGIKDLYCMDLLDVPFANEFDCIFAFDVLEHIDDDLVALKNMKSMLKNNTKSLLALSVPAHKWLWNAHDVSVHHKRRYTKKELVDLMQQSGFDIICAKYFFISITPLLWVRALLHSAPYPTQDSHIAKAHIATQNNTLDSHTESVAESHKEELHDTPPPALINKALLGICRLENKIQHYLPQNLNAPFGGSLLVVGTSNK